MIQKVFLDTNVLVDLLLEREPYAHQTEQIFHLRDEYEFEIFVSALSLANIAYIMDKIKKRPHAIIGKILQLAIVVELNHEVIRETVVSKFEDFEDGLQYFSASRIEGIDAIVTRNKKDFRHSLIRVATPQEFLESFTA